jgi:hypothetical protein
MNDISSALQSRNVDDSATLEVKIGGTDRTKKKFGNRATKIRRRVLNRSKSSESVPGDSLPRSGQPSLCACHRRQVRAGRVSLACRPGPARNADRRSEAFSAVLRVQAAISRVLATGYG